MNIEPHYKVAKKQPDQQYNSDQDDSDFEWSEKGEYDEVNLWQGLDLVFDNRRESRTKKRKRKRV